MTRRARAWDVGGMALSAGVAAVVAIDGLESGALSDSRAFVAVILSCAATASLWWRHRWPVGVALALVIPAALTEAVGGAELVVIYTVACSRSWRVAAGVGALHVAASLVFAKAFMAADEFVANGILSVAFLSIPMAWGIIVKARREVIDSLRERAERAEYFALERADRVRGQERERIAREMHDALAHRISMVSLHAGALEVRSGADRAEIEAIAATIRASAHGALDDLREILGVLRSEEDGPSMRPGSGIAEIPALLDAVRAAGVVVEYENALPSDVEVQGTLSRNVFRVVQEGLTNAGKHAFGAAVYIRVAVDGECLAVSLTNTLGESRTELPGAHTGLIGLAERTALAGGRLAHGVRVGDGPARYVLEAWLPWPK